MEIDSEITNAIKSQLECIKSQPFFLCISGSDNYGFASEGNSDVDIRGAYYYNDPDEIFKTHLQRKLTREGEYIFKGMKYEWQLHEVSKFLSLLGRSNMNVLDWIYSHDWFVFPPEFMGYDMDTFRKLGTKYIDSNMVNHALGWTKHMYNMSWREPKKILHSLRPLMTCIYYFETDVYEPNIQVMVESGSFRKYRPLILRLIELKKTGVQTSDVIRNECLQAYDDLISVIEDKRNQIPDSNTAQDEIAGMITDIRLKTLRELKVI